VFSFSGRLTHAADRAYGPLAGGRAQPRAQSRVPQGATGRGGLHEVVIIGGGPAGLTAGIYCRMRKLSVLLVDAGRAGGQLVSVYADKPVHDWPGRAEVVADDLAGQLVAHARELDVEFAEHEKVVDVRRLEDRFEVVTHDARTQAERVHPAASVIIAIGAGAFEPRRLGAPGEEGLSEDFITYRRPEPAKLAGRTVVVVGGGDSGLESAQAAHRAGASVTIVHTHAGLKGMEINLDLVNQMHIPRLLDTKVKELVVEDGALKAVVVETRGEPGTRRLDCDFLVVNVGAAANLEAVQGWGVEVVGGHIRVDNGMQTSRPGIFACGDIVTYEGKHKLLITASSEGAVAANSAYAFVRKPPRVTMKDLYR
jgi:thioredoxin reductase